MVWHGTEKNIFHLEIMGIIRTSFVMDRFVEIPEEVKDKIDQLEKKSNICRETKAEEDRIREMKKSVDYKRWLDLRKSIEYLRGRWNTLRKTRRVEMEAKIA